MLGRCLLLGSLFAASIVACASAEPPASSASEAVVQLAADPGTACPAPFDQAGHGPRAGANAGFLVADQNRSFQLLLPPASFRGPRPLFLAFHGTGQTGAEFVRSARLAEWAARGFIVVAPDSAGNGTIWPVWDGMHLLGTAGEPNADLALVDALLGCTAAHFSVDAKRVFVGGHSAGGIFTNHVLRSRSKVLAGGIVASGIWDFTEATTPAPLDPMTVIVTWGGDNDGFSGASAGSKVSGLTFVEEAALESRYYEGEPAVAQAYCRGNDVGHEWLPLNDWYIDILLARPKGTPPATLSALPPLPPNAPVRCSLDVYQDPPFPQTTCRQGTQANCREACQLFADCALENKTVGTALASELVSIGLTHASCDACVERCAAGATTDADRDVLACFARQQAAVACTGGMEGALPLFAAVDTCCENRGDSAFCADVCKKLTASIGGIFLHNCPQ